MSGTYMAMLAKDTPSPLLPTDSETNVSTGDPEGTDASAAKPERPGAPAGPGAKPGEKPGEKKVAETKIDPEGLIDRVVKLPVNGRVFFCDGKKLWFTSLPERPRTAPTE